MVAAFPVVKFGALLLKQISKPIAAFVMRRAKNNVFFRTYVCMPPAQIYHWYDVRLKMYLSNIIRTSKSEPIPKLNEAAAIELGANLLGEFIIISMATGILVWEYNRQKEKEYQREEDEQTILNELEYRITDQAFVIEELDTKLRELTRLVYATPQIMVAKSKQPTGGIDDCGSATKATSVVTLAKAVTDAKIKIRPG